MSAIHHHHASRSQKRPLRDLNFFLCFLYSRAGVDNRGTHTLCEKEKMISGGKSNKRKEKREKIKEKREKEKRNACSP